MLEMVEKLVKNVTQTKTQQESIAWSHLDGNDRRGPEHIVVFEIYLLLLLFLK